MQRLALCLAFAISAAWGADLSTFIGEQLRAPILNPRQTTVETQVYTAALVKPIPAARDAASWTQQAARLRADILANVVFRGRAAEWRQIPTKVEWLDTLPGTGYTVRKFRYEAVPGMWVPGLLYEPADLKGRVPAVLNLNGHEIGGMSIPYIQERCINLARKGMLAYNIDWFWKGQMVMDGYSHNRINQLDLVGTSGLAPMFLAQKRLVDIALQHPHVDPARIAVTGLSGGGWQTIMLSSLDPRVTLSAPVAGYSSFVTRVQFPDMDLGDSEQAPSDLGAYADYTVLTAMLAPRPAMVMGNARDSCCFRADYAISPLLVAARPFYSLYGKSNNLQYHISFDEGHNYLQDNREALYGFLGEHFFAGDAKYSAAEIPSAADVKKSAALLVPLPDANEDFHTLAMKLCDRLPERRAIPADAARAKLRAVVRWPEFRTVAHSIGESTTGGIKVSRFRLSMGNALTVPAVVFEPEDATSTTLIFGDEGRGALAGVVSRLIAEKHRVVAVDAFYFGEAAIGRRDSLYALQIASLGGRPLGIQSSQIAAVARWAQGQFGPVTLLAVGPRSGVIALVSAAVETKAIASVELVKPLRSLREVIERNLEAADAPELFCFGLLEAFDINELKALVASGSVAERR